MLDEKQKEFTPQQKLFLWFFSLIQEQFSIEDFNKEPFYDSDRKFYYKIESIIRQPESGYQEKLLIKDTLLNGFVTFNALNGRFVEAQIQVSEETFKEALSLAELMVKEFDDFGAPDRGYTLTPRGFLKSERRITNKINGAYILFIHPIFHTYHLTFRPGPRKDWY